ncbi:hypothetical protein V2J09_003576, partial [Rumex salicifolius]
LSVYNLISNLKKQSKSNGTSIQISDPPPDQNTFLVALSAILGEKKTTLDSSCFLLFFSAGDCTNTPTRLRQDSEFLLEFLPACLLVVRILLQCRMTPTDNQAAWTIQSYGAKLARNHLHDWLILLVLVAFEIVLLKIHPFYRFVGKDMMTDLKYPLKSNTVPIWAVPLYAVLLPILVFVFFYFRKRNVYDLHHAILGLLYSVLITAVLTDAIKDAVGRPRPDFFWRCFPDGNEIYDAIGNVICHGEDSVIREGHKSFPSGSFTGLGFLSLYLCGKMKVFDSKGHIAKLCIVLLPLLAAALVAVSRVDDYWHHWQDVFTGGTLGFVVAFLCYHQFFPPPYDHKGWGCYAYLQAVEEMRRMEQEMSVVSSEVDDGDLLNGMVRHVDSQV